MARSYVLRMKLTVEEIEALYAVIFNRKDGHAKLQEKFVEGDLIASRLRARDRGSGREESKGPVDETIIGNEEGSGQHAQGAWSIIRHPWPERTRRAFSNHERSVP